MTYERMVHNFADGVNIDTEKPMHGASAKCMTSLVRELRLKLQQHALTQHAQVRGVSLCVSFYLV